MSIKELREQLTDQDIVNILAQFDVEPVKDMEDDTSITFPTCDHNLEGGSPKLVYYKNTKLFVSYTDGINKPFDIFELLRKMMSLRGKEISLRQAIELCDLDAGHMTAEEIQMSSADDIRHLQELNGTYIPDIDSLGFKTYDKDVLRKFGFDYMGLMPWIQEGISIEAMQKFNIKYDSYNEAIIIPNFDIKGNLIGVRARFFRPLDVAKGKYRPIFKDGILYNHPTGRAFYGIFENQEAIKKKHLAIIFEGEKSVLRYASIYGCDNNVALATLGQNISREHIQYLLKMKVRNVILAYDTDYEDYDELKEVEENYLEKARILSQFFNVSVLIDYDFLLPYKSSPIDGGKDIFEKLLISRRRV